MTDWFRNARFVRFLSLRHGTDDVALKGDSFRLLAGQTHELALSHYQAAEVTARDPFAVGADADTIRIIGRAGFDIASRYDVVRIVLHTVGLQRHSKRQTVVTIRPEEGVQGPTIGIPITVYSSWARTLALVGATMGVLVVFGLPAVFSTWSTSVKFALILVGAFGASALQYLGLSITIPSGSGYPTGTSTSQAEVQGGSAGGAAPPRVI